VVFLLEREKENFLYRIPQVASLASKSLLNVKASRERTPTGKEWTKKKRTFNATLFPEGGEPRRK
jgi:hypothetical protein